MWWLDGGLAATMIAAGGFFVVADRFITRSGGPDPAPNTEH